MQSAKRQFLIFFYWLVCGATLVQCCSGATEPKKERASASPIFPGQGWLEYASPEEAGFSSEKLAQARQYADEIGSAAVMVVYRGAVLAHWGPMERRYMCHSIRKSFLSALYGIHAAEGTIDLDKTMAELGIDEVTSLTGQEKAARIRDLLQARSGIYHPAAYETAAMKKERPERGSHLPGTFYYYNNWDFNALGTIFERQTQSTIFQEFKTRLADPLQMEDFRVQDGYYHLEKEHSLHPAYPFRMSARDMARFGLLFLREGQWRGRQIIPKEWIHESTRPHSIVDTNRGYGYLWWTVRAEPFQSLGTFAARGFGGHSITVVPGADLVFVHRVDTWWDLGFTHCAKGTPQKVGNEQRLRLLSLILEAQVSPAKAEPSLVPLLTPLAHPNTIRVETERLDRCVGVYEFAEGDPVQIRRSGNGPLQLQSARAGTFNLLPIQEAAFLIEDLDAPVSFVLGQDGKPILMAIEWIPGQPCYGRALSGPPVRPRDLEAVTGTLNVLTPQLMADLKVPGVSISVIWEGRLAWHQGYGVVRAGQPEKVTPATVFEACSMSKVAFTYVVLKLAEQGRIDLDRPLVEYLDKPYLEEEPLHRLITARMVMTHTTGFPNWRPGGWRKGGPISVTFTPGTQYGYSGEGFLYLQRVVEHLTGTPLQPLMKEMLFDPLGMVSSSYVWEPPFDQSASAGHDQAGQVKIDRPLYRQANAAYSLYCTPDDYARFILEVIKEDRSAPHSLGRDSIRDMFTPQLQISGEEGNPIRRPGPSAYVSVARGLGWVLGQTEGQGMRAWHSGSNGSGFRCHSEFNLKMKQGLVIMTGSVRGHVLCRELVRLCDFP